MRLSNVNIVFMQVTRATQIVWVIWRNVMGEFFSRTFIGRAASRRAIRRGHAHVGSYSYNTAERLRFVIEELGPTYVKFGQILADRPDIVSARFREQLKKLQSQARPFSDVIARKIIVQELSVPLDVAFKSIDTKCFAAASLGQVYHATLVDGTDVVIKVQRPQIEHKIHTDVVLMRYLAKQLAVNYPEMAAVNIVALVDDFSEGIVSELDYRNEANNTERFVEMFKDEDQVYIPCVYRNFTTRRLLVMERVVGVTPDSQEALLNESLDPHVVAVTGAKAMVKMILEHGFFHADPHPGNLFVMKNNVVAFIDFGMVGILRPKDIDFLANFALGYAYSDSRMVAAALMELCNVKYFDYNEELEFDLSKMMRASKNLSIEDMDIAKNIQASIHIVIKYKFKIPAGIFMLVKSLATIQQVGEVLDPKLSLTPIVVPYAQNIVKNRFTRRKIFDQIYDVVMDYAKVIRDLPNDISEILYKMKQGTIRHEIKLDDEAIFISTFRKMSLRIAYVILLVGGFLGSSIMIAFGDSTNFGKIILYCSMVLIVLLLGKWLLRK